MWDGLSGPYLAHKLHAERGIRVCLTKTHRVSTLHRELRSAARSAYLKLSLTGWFRSAINNIAKPISASTVNIHLNSTDNILELCVEDIWEWNTVEAALAKKDSFGLSGMIERVALLGGKFQIRSLPGRGTGLPWSCRFGRTPCGVTIIRLVSSGAVRDSRRSNRRLVGRKEGFV